ncbi:MAG: pyridoxal-phosphate dependent enzyme [Candidatus Solibacter usitatus]|nr:pyridoxal-phosphate dependent enzyme [Candidatus Solibacter usitatus]
MSVSYADVEQAASRIAPHINRTPVMTSRTLDDRSGKRVFLKCENFQRGGSFKLRGGVNFLFSMSDDDVHRGVVAFSSGNHAQAVAIAAGLRGSSATVVMPDDASKSKAEGVRAYGGRIIFYNRFRDDREAIGRNLAAETGATLVPPFDHPWIIAGQGTAAREMLSETGPLDAVVTCVGGGGLLSGSAISAHALHPSTRVFGVEPALANDWALSMEAGHPVAIPPSTTIADGLRSPQPGAITFPIVRKLVEKIILVTEEEILDAMRFLLFRMKILVEPSGAVSVAGVLSGKLPAEIRSVGVIVSGGNVDMEVVRSL